MVRARRTQHSIRTHCPYCALQCGMLVQGPRQRATAVGDPSFPVNKGALCIKGWTSTGTLNHPDRLLMPLARTSDGRLLPCSWEDAMAHVVSEIKRIQNLYGKEAVGVFGGGGLTNEKAYLLGKFARIALGTPHIDYNGRFCMSSAAAACNKALGLDRGLPFPLQDAAQAEVVMLVGANPAETMPPMMQYLGMQQAAGGTLIVADPRRTATARMADLHLRLLPGTDAALLNGLLHVLIREGMVDEAYVQARTEGFNTVRHLVAAYWPERVERITGVPEEEIVHAARILGSARRAILLTGRGAEQQSQGVNNVLACINLALALGLIGRPGSGYGCITGQGNGQGGREHGQKADQLPGYRSIEDPEARRQVARVWGIDEDELPGAGMSAYELLDSLGGEGGIRALLVIGSNPVVSAPRSLHVESRLRSLELLVVADFFMSETAKLAHVVLPTTQWAEEEGTMTNLEGRVIRRRRVYDPPSGVRTDLEIICQLADGLGKGKYFQYTCAEEVFEELRRASAGGKADYSGITYARLEENDGIYWPCPSLDHPGTPRLFEEAFPTPSGKARFHPVTHTAPAEEPDDEYPLYLITGRVLAQYQSGNQTRRLGHLQAIAPGPRAEVHPSTAAIYDLRDGQKVKLISRRGESVATVKITREIIEGVVFVAFHWGGEGSINRLTNPALDPTSRMPEFKVCAARIQPIAEH